MRLGSGQDQEMGFKGRTRNPLWIRAQTAQTIGMARKLGLGKAIDGLCSTSPRTVTPGDTFEIMLGSISSRPEEVAIYNVRKFYDGAPLEALFGKPIDIDSLNASSLSRNLDAIGAVPNKDRFLWEQSRKATRMYGLKSNVLHGDGTCFRFTGDPKEEMFPDHVAIPKHGHPKISDDAKFLQYNAYGIVDSNRILSTSMPHDGNVSDVTMNKNALDFLEEVEGDDVKRIVFVADCKLSTSSILQKMDSMGIGYVSKFADNSIDGARNKALEAALPELGLDGYDNHVTRLADVDITTNGIVRRTVVLINTAKYRDALQRIETHVGSKLMHALDKMSKKVFESKEAAEEHLRSHLSSRDLVGYDLRYGFKEKSVRVRPHQGPDAKDEAYRTVYSLDIDVRFDRDRAAFAALSTVAAVLVTNLGRIPSDDGDVRKGASKETVLELYNGQFVCEHAFRLMKSGLGLDSIYLHSPLRVDAMLFIIALATMVFTLMDAILREQNLDRGATVYRLRIELMNSRMVYDDGDWWFEGTDDRMEMFLERLSIFSMNPNSFLDPTYRE